VQLAELRAGAKCVSATPGRLLGLVREGHLQLNKVRYFVMDEADRMLDMGFEPSIREIASFLGERPQTLLFSATWPVSIQKLAAEFVNNPVHVTVGNVDQLTSNQSVTQIVEVIDENSYRRQQRLLQLLQKYHSTRKNKILIFVLYKKEVPQVARILEQKGYGVSPISSDFKQNERMAALENFRSGRKPILIATDVAARGLDIDNVSHVINFSFPLTVEDYIHRIGRTGRGGATGLAHTFFTQQNKTLAGELVGVLEDAGAEVPEALRAFGCYTKVKEHSMYGAHFKAAGSGKPMPTRKRVTF
jgi:ATP-dependent RNA helicase DBP3